MAADGGVRTSVKLFVGLFAVLVLAGVIYAIAKPSTRRPVSSPVVWYDDAGNWIRIPLAGAEGQHLVGAAISDDRLIAVGSGSDSGTVWTSDDGRDWTCSWSGEGLEPHDVAVGGPGWVVVGGSWEAAIMTSEDGESWRRVLDASATALWAVTAFDSTLVAGGGSWTGSGEVAAAVWVSDDGEEWSRIVLPAGEGSQVVSLAKNAAGLLAVADTGVFWSSADGRRWESWPTAGLDPMSIQGVAGTDWLLAVGWNWDGTPGMWRSDDGHTWEAVPAPEDWSPFGAAPLGDDVLALGQRTKCLASMSVIASDGSVNELTADDPLWSSDECIEGIPVPDGACDDGAARLYDAVVLGDGDLVAVGYR